MPTHTAYHQQLGLHELVALASLNAPNAPVCDRHTHFEEAHTRSWMATYAHCTSTFLTLQVGVVIVSSAAAALPAICLDHLREI
jgi:hypothetical protein